MTDKVQTPLSAAQALVDQIQAGLDKGDAAATKALIEQLRDHLQRAQGTADTVPAVPNAGGASNEVAELRAQLDKIIEETASFASLMVHEIRKPMTSMRGYADMLAKPDMIGPLNDMQKQFLATIRRNISQMEGLVSDISDISKLNSGRLRLDNKMTTFGQVILDVQKQVEPLVTEYGHTVTWDVPQGLPILNTDTKQLSKVVYYLVRNAIQYTPKTTGQLVVKAERVDGNTLHLTVTDNGIGMNEQEIARLGELFYRADHELVTSERGYGLGLPIVMGFVKLMGGTFDPVVSTPEKGSTFGFRIPGMG
jgi:signal transduction histidine kinase